MINAQVLRDNRKNGDRVDFVRHCYRCPTHGIYGPDACAGRVTYTAHNIDELVEEKNP
jgi:hypothetical protein